MFGSNGVAFVNLGLLYVYNSASALEFQPDGKIVVAGTSFVSRLDRDGAMDSTFGGDGTVSTSGYGRDLLIQPDGKVVVAGIGNFDFAVTRYNGDGSLDNTFGTQGTVFTETGATTAYGRYDTAWGVALQTNGRLLLTGQSPATATGDKYSLGVVRYLASGKLDTSFSFDGMLKGAICAGGDIGRAVLVQADGKIVIAGIGTASNGWSESLEMVRYASTGARDLTFGAGGKVLQAASMGSSLIAAVQQQDGKIVLGASIFTDSGAAFLALRYDRDGHIDTTFGEGGMAIVEGLGASSLAIQGDGKIVFAGSKDSYSPATGPGLDIAVGRLNADGSLDTGFSDDGVATTNIAAYDHAYAVAIQPDGKIVVAAGAGGAAVVVRYLANGALDDVPTNVAGTEADDQLLGPDGADTIAALGGDDRVTGAGGDDRIDGGDGFDYAVYVGNMADYGIAVAGTAIAVSDNIDGRDGTDSLANIERIRFADCYVAFDLQGDAGQAYRLYQAAFNRSPDLAGLGYQTTELDNGMALRQVAQNFINSPEFTRAYGSLDDIQFVTQLYANVLHRAPDEGGLQFHTGNLASGVNTRADVLVGFSESPENQAALIGAIAGGIVYTL